MLRLLLKLILWSFLAIVSILCYLTYYYTRNLPDYSYLANYNPPATTRIYSMDGKLLEEYALEYRIFVPIQSIPKLLINAFISAEDRNFFQHKGIDPLGILRASINNINNLLNYRRIESGSTITQQVVKNFLLNPKKTLERKIQEVVLSYMVSKVFTKEQILELYLNQIFLGYGVYGVAAAAQAYFNKSIDNISLQEAAFLAGLPKAPSQYDPQKNYDKAKIRRDYVIKQMLKNGYITNLEAEKAIDSPIVLYKKHKNETVKADYYAEQVRTEIINKFGKDFFYTGGLTIITSLNTKYQTIAEKALKNGIKEFDIKTGYRGPLTNISLNEWQKNLQNINAQKLLNLAVILNINDQKITIGLQNGEKGTINFNDKNKLLKKFNRNLLKKGDVVIIKKIDQEFVLQQIPEINGAILVMNSNTGQVLAMVGGFDFNFSKFNRANQAQRQAGSLIKTFIYLSALEKGILPNTTFYDGPISLTQGRDMPLWKPKNYKSKFLGNITMRTALEKSKNLAPIRVAQKIGIEDIIEIIKRFDINDNPNRMFSIVLGAVETTLLKMVNAYSILVNGGYEIKPSFIELIQDRNGNVIYKRSNSLCTNCSSINHDEPYIVTAIKKRIVDEASAYQIVSMLLGTVQRGTAINARFLGNVGGKTGSTNNSLDTWFVGFTKNITIGTYLGYDIPKTLGQNATGASLALPIFIEFAKTALDPEEIEPFSVPETIKLVNIDPETGQLYNGPGSITEAFKTDTNFNNINNNSRYEKESENLHNFIPNDFNLDEIY